MPRQYPAGFRDEMVRRMLDGESVLGSGVVESGEVPYCHRSILLRETASKKIPEAIQEVVP